MPDPRTVEATWKTLLSDVKAHAGLLAGLGEAALHESTPCSVVFGTSGWRGIIGADYTLANLRIVTQAIIHLIEQADGPLLAALGVRDAAELRRRGFVVGHDNRYLGPRFAAEVMGLLQAAGIKVYYAGEAITPEFSTALQELGAACAINLTPSHNPANWAGFKFNPADGGPAGAEITTVIERLANAAMAAGERVAPPAVPASPERVDSTALYERFVNARGTLDLQHIRHFVRQPSLSLVIDHVHGATRGRPPRLLGDSPRIQYQRTSDDCLFGGIAPEPSEKNMAGVTAALAACQTPLKLGVIMDPDGDRIRFTDGVTQVAMNDFGALALHYLHVHKGLRGGLVKSVATSNFANAIAAHHGLPIIETAVGFKNFRPYLLPDSQEPAIVAFEESDGISGYRHTLEKDAIFGLLLALEMMAVTGLNLGDYLRQLQAKYGAYYPDRAGIEVDRALTGDPLKRKLGTLAERFRPGVRVQVGQLDKVIKAVNPIDGTKIVFADDSWLLVRPSGTEPKVRFYIETRSAAERPIMAEAAAILTRQALGS